MLWVFSRVGVRRGLFRCEPFPCPFPFSYLLPIQNSQLNKSSENRASLVNTTLSKCPNTILSLAGYSQGAQLIHDAVPLLPANTTNKISSIVMFGDPKNGTAIAGVDNTKVMTICHAGDNICQGGEVRASLFPNIVQLFSFLKWGK